MTQTLYAHMNKIKIFKKKKKELYSDRQRIVTTETMISWVCQENNFNWKETPHIKRIYL
jgi:hypothetical protein